MPHNERHATGRIGWLRAAVLGANDGILSTSSLVAGVAAAAADPAVILLTGVAGLVAGALSMAAGEYVSVSSQADAERADLDRERQELAGNPAAELEELTGIYVARGLTRATASEVARQLTEAGALEAHTRDELGLIETSAANPIQASLTSALAFAVGAGVPVLVVWLTPAGSILVAVYVTSVLSLAVLGALGAASGGARIGKPIARVVFWGVAAMVATTSIGWLFRVQF